MQQKKYTSLDGSAEVQGDLKAVVLHGMEVSHVKSTFPVSLGARITGVDDATYTSTGEAFSHVILPNSENNSAKKLQADDVSLGTALRLYHVIPQPCILFLSPCSFSCSHSLRILEEIPYAYGKSKENEPCTARIPVAHNSVLLFVQPVTPRRTSAPRECMRFRPAASSSSRP